MREQEIVGIWEAYNQIYKKENHISTEEFVFETFDEFRESDIYYQVFQGLLNEGYSEEDSNTIIINHINEGVGGLAKLIGKFARGVAKTAARRASTPLRTGAADVAATALTTQPANVNLSKQVIKSFGNQPSAIVRTVKPTSVRTAPKGANISPDPWKVPSSRVPKSQAPSTKPTSSAQNLLPPGKPGGSIVSTRAPKPTFKPEALPKPTTPKAERGGALVSTRAPKPTFKPEALPKPTTPKAEPAGALVSTRAPKPTFKPEALPKPTTKPVERGGALVSTRAPKPTFKPEALPKPTTPKAERGGALVSTRAPKPTFKPEALPKPTTKPVERGGALVSTRAPKSSSKISTKTPDPTTGSGGGTGSNAQQYAEIGKKYKDMAQQRRIGRGKTDLAKLATGGAVGGIGAASIAGMGLSQNNDGKKDKNIKTNVYNTVDKPSMDKPVGKIRSRLVVGSRKVGSTFDDAYREAKRKVSAAKSIGDKAPTTFNYGGKEYAIEMVEEILVNYVIEGGFASDEKSAQVIVDVMSEEWKRSIIGG